eukprot:Stramenopile-MAST_4_protein_50
MYSGTFGGRAGRSKRPAPKKKNKCNVCGKKGHVMLECPKIKCGEVDPNKVQSAISKGGAGSGRGNRSTRKAKSASADGVVEQDGPRLPVGFFRSTDFSEKGIAGHISAAEYPFLFFDAGCDVGATIDTIEQLKKVKRKYKPTELYQKAIATSAANYGGCICRQYLKLGRAWDESSPRIAMIKEADSRVWFALGLGPQFIPETSMGGETDETPTGHAALISAISADLNVVGVFANLNYNPEVLHQHGQDRGAQLCRLRTTCKVAIEKDLPIQVRILPGGGSDDEGMYTAAWQDLANMLIEMEESQTPLRVHLVCWAGKAEHMVKLLQAFPDTLFVGFNGTVGYSKAVFIHESAFDVPLNRLLLESDAPFAIPTAINEANSAISFCHPGLIPYVAAAIAEQKKGTYTALDVARVASDNCVRLYGRGVSERAAQACAEANERAVKAAAAEKRTNGNDPTPSSAVGDDGTEVASKKKRQERSRNDRRNNQKDQPSQSSYDDAISADVNDIDFDLDFFSVDLSGQASDAVKAAFASVVDSGEQNILKDETL